MANIALPPILARLGVDALPAIRMAPFQLADLKLASDVEGATADPLADRLGRQALLPRTADRAMYTASGRAAIRLALEAISPAASDEILILTSSGNAYVSGCVTQEIERLCKVTRQPSDRTVAYFLIHEFGRSFNWPAHIPCDPGLPVIEDRAYGLGLPFVPLPSGRLADYVVYSLTKAFPLPAGGLLVTEPGRHPPGDPTDLDIASRNFLMAQLARCLPSLAQAVEQRRRHHALYARTFRESGVEPLFGLAPQDIPHAFLFCLPDEDIGRQLKSFLAARNIESSPYWGAGGYFLPNHQGMTEDAVRYVAATVLGFLAAQPART